MSASVFLAAALLGGDNVDRTGIHWALPFKSALPKATAEHRLLLIKPIAFGTSKDGGW